MRSSKSRSRNKSRNPRALGNIVNRVFDSSGPEGKVRGTPQQIIEKYLALARDAQLSNDRVAEQSFLQHAEHYTRMLGEAQREQAERQAQFGGQPGFDGREERSNGHPYQNGHPQPERRDERGDNRNDARRDENRNEGRNEGRRDERGENRQQRRDDRNEQRGDRREDREEARREDVAAAAAPAAPEPMDHAPPQIMTEAAQFEEAPVARPAQGGFDLVAPEETLPATDALPEALGDADNVPVETPESRDESAEAAGERPRARKSRATTTTRRAPQQRRRRNADEAEAPADAPAPAADE